MYNYNFKDATKNLLIIYYVGTKAEWQALNNTWSENTTVYYNRQEGANTAKAFVRRMYKVALGRSNPSADEINYWYSMLKSGEMTGAQVVEGFYQSTEMLNNTKKQSNPNDYFVSCAYQGIMGRNPDANGKAYWVSGLNSSASYRFVVCGFADSDEFARLCQKYGVTKGRIYVTENRAKNINVTKFCYRLYKKALGRNPDIKGLNDWCGKIINDPSKKNVINVSKNFFNSTEYKNKKTTNDQYLTDLYNTFFDRGPDANGMNYWRTQLKNGSSRDKVLNGFADSNEFKQVMAQFGL